MTHSTYIVETIPTSCSALVPKKSEHGTVMVYYWSLHAGPCMKLMSRLIQLADEYTGAMAQLLEIVRRERTFRDEAERKGLIAIFNMLGKEDEAVTSYPALLTEALN